MALASPPGFARRHVNQHQVHGPAAKPVLGLRRRPARQRNFVTIEASHPRPMHVTLPPWKPILPSVVPRRGAGEAEQGWDGSNSHRSRVTKRPPNLALRRGEHQIADLPPHPACFNSGTRLVNAFTGYCHRVPWAKTPKLCWRSHWLDREKSRLALGPLGNGSSYEDQH